MMMPILPAALGSCLKTMRFFGHDRRIPPTSEEPACQVLCSSAICGTHSRQYVVIVPDLFEVHPHAAQ
ncbi:hypothetical protein THTE_3246 [Thermogutta terrifontis]|uniref:Uncharacterized protein n=1 Tax=Thermogutta terrifontis TaxID=1331910 RepID=A0A286RIR1_9BACT|nr:hypothetical protein THTE_3246 [Thermogutta terrifontis]